VPSFLPQVFYCKVRNYRFQIITNSNCAVRLDLLAVSVGSNGMLQYNSRQLHPWACSYQAFNFLVHVLLVMVGGVNVDVNIAGDLDLGYTTGMNPDSRICKQVPCVRFSRSRVGDGQRRKR
jgi:hypothetical protein